MIRRLPGPQPTAQKKRLGSVLKFNAELSYVSFQTESLRLCAAMLWAKLYILFTQMYFVKMTKYGFLYPSIRSFLCLSHGSQVLSLRSQGLGTDETKIENFLGVISTLTFRNFKRKWLQNVALWHSLQHSKKQVKNLQ